MSGSKDNKGIDGPEESSNPKRDRIITIVFGVVVVAVVGVLIWWGLKPDAPKEEETAPSPSISEPANTPEPESTASGPEPDLENQPPPEENDGTTDKPNYVDGVPYSQSEQGTKEWEPVRRKFLQAFTSKDEIAPQVKDITDEATQKKLQKEKAGAYSDMQLAVGDDEDSWYHDEDVRPFSFTQVFSTDSDKQLYVSMEYVFDGEKGEWLVTGYDVK